MEQNIARCEEWEPQYVGKGSVQDQRIEQNSVGIALPGLPPLPWAVRSTVWPASITTVTTNNKQ